MCDAACQTWLLAHKRLATHDPRSERSVIERLVLAGAMADSSHEGIPVPHYHGSGK